jgi:phosphoenolpyruvate carboxylase
VSGRFSKRCFEHGYGASEEQYRNRLTLRGACRGHRAARSYLSAVRAEWHSTIEMLLAITGQQALPDQNPLLARSIKNRFPYLDPLNHIQIELLKRHRTGNTDERVVQAIHVIINVIAAGLRNSAWSSCHPAHFKSAR